MISAIDCCLRRSSVDKVSSDVSGGVLDIGASIAVAINSKTCNKKGQE